MANKRAKKEVPLPPGAQASVDELEKYFEKHSLQELEAAGYVAKLLPEEQKEMDALAQECQSRVAERKSARKQLNLAMTQDQIDRFVRYANKKHIPPSTLAKAWILERLDQEAT